MFRETSLADAEGTEDLVEDFFNVHTTYDVAQGLQGFTGFECDELWRILTLQRSPGGFEAGGYSFEAGFVTRIPLSVVIA